MPVDPYEFLIQKFNLANTAMLKAAPPQPPFGQQAPGFPSQLADAITQTKQQANAQTMKQNDFMAGLAEKIALAKERQKQTSDLDNQIKQARLDSIRAKMQQMTKSNPYVLKDMTMLTSLYNRIASTKAQGGDTSQMEKMANALETHLSPYMGVEKSEVPELVPGILGTSIGAKEVMTPEYKAFEQTPTPQAGNKNLKPMTTHEKSIVKTLRDRKVPEEKIKAAVEADGFAWQP